jgi:predicted O-methyltransferase YrrM
MALALPRVAFRRGEPFRAIAKTARTIALDRIPEDERDWATRIGAYKQGLHSREEAAQPFEPRLPSTVAEAAFWTPMPSTWGEFLMRLVREAGPRSCLELGTGIGISTAYQAAAMNLNGGGRLLSLDGSAEYAGVAERGLAELGLAGVEFAVGPIMDSLPDAVTRVAPIEYALIDAEHTEEATMDYFHGVVPHMAPGGMMVFDDIPWDRELRRTWQRIAKDGRIEGAYGLGRVGVAVVGH